MAATVTPNLTDITLGETGDNGYWTGTDGNSTEVFRQGSASQGWLVGKSTNETAVYDAYTSNGSAVEDMSATDTHLYITIRCDIAPFIDYLRFGLTSTTADGAATSGTNWWTIIDNTTNLEWYGEWKTFVLDVNDTNTDADSSGTLDLSAISDVEINVDNSNSGNIRSIENTYIDPIRYGTGLTITGTAWDFDDIALIDTSNTFKWDIIRKVGAGVFELNGRIIVGNGATTTAIASSGETLFFKDVSTSGEAGGLQGYTSAGLYKLIFQGSGNTSVLTNVSVSASSVAQFVLDADDTNLPTDGVKWNGGLITNASSVLLEADSTYKGITFSDCGQVVPSTCVFENNTIVGYTGSEGGALLWPGGTNVKDCIFTNNLKSIEIAQTTTQTYDNLQFTDEDNTTKQSTHLNNGGTSITINKNNGSNPQYYTATGGGTVTFNLGVDLTVTVKDEDRVAIENAQTSIHLLASPFTELMNEDTLSTGVATEAYAFVTDVDVVLKVRKSDAIDNPRYEAFSAVVTITSDGLTRGVTLKEQSLPI